MDGFECIKPKRQRKGGLFVFYRQLRKRYREKFEFDYPGDVKIVMSALGKLKERGVTEQELAEMIDWFIGGLAKPLYSAYVLSSCYEDYKKWRHEHDDVLPQYIYDYRCNRSRYDAHFRTVSATDRD